MNLIYHFIIIGFISVIIIGFIVSYTKQVFLEPLQLAFYLHSFKNRGIFMRILFFI